MSCDEGERRAELAHECEDRGGRQGEQVSKLSKSMTPEDYCHTVYRGVILTEQCQSLGLVVMPQIDHQVGTHIRMHVRIHGRALYK